MFLEILTRVKFVPFDFNVFIVHRFLCTAFALHCQSKCLYPKTLFHNPNLCALCTMRYAIDPANISPLPVIKLRFRGKEWSSRFQTGRALPPGRRSSGPEAGKDKRRRKIMSILSIKEFSLHFNQFQVFQKIYLSLGI